MREVGLEEVEEYIMSRQNTVAQYIVTRTILYICEEAERHPGTWVSMWLWDQEVLKLTGAWAAEAREMGESEVEAESL